MEILAAMAIAVCAGCWTGDLTQALEVTSCLQQAAFAAQKDASAQDANTTKDDSVTKSKKHKDDKKRIRTGADTSLPAGSVAIGGGSESTETRDRFMWKPRPSFRLGNILRIDFETKLQEDLHRSYDGADLSVGLSAFELQRSRVGIEGSLFTHIEYEIERELTVKELTLEELAVGMTPKSPWKDVNLNVDYIKPAQVQVGKFKIPFGLDELTGITHNDFAYRSLGAEYLAPARDIGVMAHGRFLKRGFSYWTGFFRHDGDNAHSKKIQGADATFAVRVAGVPLRRLAAAHLDGLEVGTAFTTSDLSDESFRPNGLRGRTVMTEDTFFSAVYVNGSRRRWEGDLDWLLGSASVRAEYTHVSDDRLGQGYNNQDLPDARYRSWYVSGTYLLTGEAKKRPIKPHADFLQGGIGAVEVAVRYERIRYDSVGGQEAPSRNPRAETIAPSGDRALTLGINWVLNRWVTLQLNTVREQVEDPDRNPVSDGAAFWSRVLRFQFVL